jgi:hypothetical protein
MPKCIGTVECLREKARTCVMVHTCNPSTLEAESEGLRV